MKLPFKNLSFRWRITLFSSALAAAACIALTILLSRSALIQLDNIENTVVQIETVNGSNLNMGVSISDVIPDISNQLQKSRADIISNGIIAMVVVILAVGSCTYFFVGHALRPLKALNERMETVQAQNLSEPLEIPASGDELSRLALSFNRMLVRLNSSFETQRRFSADAAHELRTPLTVVQTDLDILARYENPSAEQYEETLSLVREQTSRLEQVIRALLEMTQLETTERSDRISVAPLIDEVLCDLEGIAENKKISLVRADGDAEITGSDLLLYRAVYNLVENAVKYNREGGSVTVACSELENNIVISVRDTGLGIPKDKWEEIFEPFVRIDKSRSRKMGGAGLGLALTRRIAREHGGDVFVYKSSENGTEIRLMLPLS